MQVLSWIQRNQLSNGSAFMKLYQRNTQFLKIYGLKSKLGLYGMNIVHLKYPAMSFSIILTWKHCKRIAPNVQVHPSRFVFILVL